MAGTDYPPGEPIEDTVVAVREMEFLTDAGLPPHQALRAGTIDAARLIKLDDQLGAVEGGYLADLIVTDADPAADIRALRAIRLVLQGGRVIRNGLPEVPVSPPRRSARMGELTAGPGKQPGPNRAGRRSPRRTRPPSPPRGTRSRRSWSWCATSAC